MPGSIFELRLESESGPALSEFSLSSGWQKKQVVAEPDSEPPIHIRLAHIPVEDKTILLDFLPQETFQGYEKQGKSGHEVFEIKVKVESDGKKNSSEFRFNYLKRNKLNDSRFSIYEVVVGAFSDIYLGDYSSHTELVFEIQEKKQGPIFGLVSRGLKNNGSLQRHHALNGDQADYFAAAGTFVKKHVMGEDDLHRKNLLVTKQNNGAFYNLQNIDDDMCYQSLAEEGKAGLGKNRRRWRQRPYGQTTFQVTRRDCESLPFLIDSDPYYWPGKQRVINGGVSLFSGSHKGYDAPLIGEDHLTSQFQELSKNDEFQKWKWYHYARYLIIPSHLIASTIQEKLKDISDESDRAKADELKAAVTDEDNKRRQAFRRELTQSPAFYAALTTNKDEFTQRMIASGLTQQHVESAYEDLIFDSCFAAKAASSPPAASPYKLSPLRVQASLHIASLEREIYELNNTHDIAEKVTRFKYGFLPALNPDNKLSRAESREIIKDINRVVRQRLMALSQQEQIFQTLENKINCQARAEDVHKIVGEFKIKLLVALDNHVERYDQYRKRIEKVDHLARERINELLVTKSQQPSSPCKEELLAKSKQPSLCEAMCGLAGALWKRISPSQSNNKVSALPSVTPLMIKGK